MDMFDLVRKAFPNGDMTHWSEVNGLPSTAVQDLIDNKNVEVLAITLDRSTILRNQYHVIFEVDGYFVYGRICDAMEGCGYDMYAALFTVVPSTDTQWYSEKVNTMLRVFSNAEVEYEYNNH